MTMTKPNASADAEKNHAGYYKKTLQRRKCSNSSAKYRTYHGTELLRLRKKPWIEEAMKEVQGEYVFLHDIDKFKGHWQEMFPGKRLCLEIGCGKGRFTIGMAELYPDKAFIGIETQHDIAYFPAKAAKDKELTNVKIICANAENLLDWFEPGEIKELYLNFSDPWPKARHAKRRLTAVMIWRRCASC